MMSHLQLTAVAALTLSVDAPERYSEQAFVAAGLDSIVNVRNHTHALRGYAPSEKSESTQSADPRHAKPHVHSEHRE